MAKKGKSKKRAPGKRPQPAKRPIAAGPASTSTGAPAKAKAAAATKTAPPATPGKATQAERIEAARRERRRKKLQLRIAIGAVVALVIGAIAANALSNKSDTQAFRDEVTAGTCTLDSRSDVASPTRSEQHVPPASYEVNPPAGGNHDPSPAPAGKYEQANAPSEPKVVHSLEHGYIAIWHQPGLPKEDLDVINKVFERYENDVLVLPRASLPKETKVAATAWGERLLCQNAELGPLTDFVARYRNEGPEKVPHT